MVSSSQPQPSGARLSVRRRLFRVFCVPALDDLPVAAGVDRGWVVARERAFTIILRIQTLLGLIAFLSVMPTFVENDIPEVGLVLLGVVGLFVLLGFLRRIRYPVRIGVYLILLYLTSLFEVLHFGFSPECFAFFLMFTILAPILHGKGAAVLSATLSILTLAIVGYLIGTGGFLPFAPDIINQQLPSLQRLASSLLVFVAAAVSLVIALVALADSLRDAWRLEREAYAALIEERDRLEERILERTEELSAARDEALHKSRELEKIFLAVEQNGNSIMIVDSEGRIEYTNPRFSELTGFSREEALGENPRIVKSGKHDQVFYQGLWETITQGRIWYGEIHNRRKDGSLFWEKATIAPLFTSEGKITHYVAVKEDITDRKAMEADLLKMNQVLEERVAARTAELDETIGHLQSEIEERRQLELALRGERDFAESLVETARAIVLVLDRGGCVVRYNRYLAELCGKPLAETRGRDCASFLLPEPIRGSIRERLIDSACNYGQWSGTNPILDANGKERMIEWHNRTLGDSAGLPNGLLSIGIDVTERVRAEAELRGLNENLERLVTERTSELYASHGQLLALNAAKDRFFSIIAHDLRNPFQAFIGYSELLRDNAESYAAQEIRNIAGMLHKSAQTSHQLLENLLAWAQSQTGRMVFDPRPQDLSLLVTAAVAHLTGMADTRGLRVEQAVPPGLWANADADMIATVLRNLISNALKFTAAGGLVRIGGRAVGETVELSVSDSGRGLSPEDLEKLFRIEVKNSEIGEMDKEKGTGLGLILCREFVERHGGRITVESEPGHGSRFTICLPRE